MTAVQEEVDDQAVAMALAVVLPRAWRATAPQGLYLDDRNYRVPDLLVYDALPSIAGGSHLATCTWWAR